MGMHQVMVDSAIISCEEHLWVMPTEIWTAWSRSCFVRAGPTCCRGFVPAAAGRQKKPAATAATSDRRL
eukprot:COSAG02_NODE_512_length_20850_cov_4.993302_11_plen_69_part_00